ncbi:hypothetical protein B7494_g4648 [Chlorociboria aeruginascens]|nr:hypothetical protein B7494_g4648 [Chlorociboria aeruginascens]
MFFRPSHNHTKATYLSTLAPLLTFSLYTSLITFLSSIFLLPFFAPSLTLSLSPTTPHRCSHTTKPTTHLLPLLPLTSLIFLLPIPLLQIQHLLLAPLAPHTPVSGFRALLLDLGTTLIGLILCIGLILLSILIALIYTSFTPGRKPAFSGLSIALVAVAVLGTAFLAIASFWESNVEEQRNETIVGGGDGLVKVRRKQSAGKDMARWKIGLVFGLYFLVFGSVVALLAIAVKQAVGGVGCIGGGGGGLWLNGNATAVPVSVVNGCCGDQGGGKETITSMEIESTLVTVATPVQESSTESVSLGGCRR